MTLQKNKSYPNGGDAGRGRAGSTVLGVAVAVGDGVCETTYKGMYIHAIAAYYTASYEVSCSRGRWLFR